MSKLLLSNFQYTANTTGVNSLLLNYVVPLNTYVTLDMTKPFHIALPTFFSTSYSAAQTSASVTVTAPTPVAVIQNMYNAPNYSLSAIGYWYNGTTYRMVKPTAISGSSITFYVNDTTSTSATLYVYYLPAAGTMSIVYQNPTSPTTITKTIFRTTLTSIHSTDQYRVPLTLAENALLPQFFTFSIYVNAPVVIQTGSVSPNYPNVLANFDMDVNVGNFNELVKKVPNIYDQILQQMTH